MTNECARAISVANHYFMLADRMIPGLENHLSKNVVLEWFGKKITGKKDVAAFIMSHKTEFFHTFDDIIPILGITTKEKQSNRSKESLDQNASDKCETHTSYCSHKELTRCSHETEMSTNHENAIDSNQENNENDTTFVHKDGCATCNIEELTYKSEIMTACNDVNVNVNVNTNIEANQNEITIANIDDQSDNLNKNDLCNLFEPEITSQAIVENINRTELKEEMAPTIRAINRECGQGDGPVIVEADTTKYLEANGTIKFLRINIQEDSLFLYHWTKIWKRKNWNQKCRLQIAYSLLIDNESPKIVNKCMQENVHSASHLNKIQKSKLPSLEEVIRDSSTLIRDKNCFNGYLQPLNFSKDREEFLKFFKAEMQEKFNAQSCARYVRNKLILDYPNKKPLLNVMYQIHMIVYTKVE
ncbi:uncharacterized protein LOC115245945 [Formica exsecta]|uniref:uncharacterized protein LOC115245945 n=1 Tax=Formica exsecta TaxID=72781 RepID=UPI001143B16E|nr:uncharacterized protein LOC115245945 [Formica exsecta]